MRKYELLRDDVSPLHFYNNRPGPLYRIRALRSFGSVKEGDLGGWIRNEDNLSHSGMCWVEDGGRVGGFAEVFDNAKIGYGCMVRDNARVSGSSALYAGVLVCDRGSVANSLLTGSVLVADNAKVVKSVLEGDFRVYEDANVFNVTANGGGEFFFDVSRQKHLTLGPFGIMNWWVTACENGVIAVGDLCKGTYEEVDHFLTKKYPERTFGKHGAFGDAMREIREFLGIADVEDGGGDC